MARLIPEDPSIIENYAERRVGIALRDSLADEWTVIWHVQGSNSGRHWEIDFALFHPQKGLAVVEVKGGWITLRDGRWTQNDEWIRDPIAQARNGGHSLRRQLPHSKELPTPAIVIAFPAVKWKGTRPTFDEEDGLLDYRHTRYEDPESRKRLNEKWEAITARMTVTLDGAQVQEIMDALNPRFEDQTVLAAALEVSIQDLESWTGQMIRFTSDQLHAMRQIDGRDRVFVSGPAGSGKTLLAISEALRVAARGGRVLFVCPSGVLLDRVTHRFADQPLVNVIAMPREGLTPAVVGGTAVADPPTPQEGTAYSDVASGISAPPSREGRGSEHGSGAGEAGYDLVIVDEYQEFSWAQIRGVLGSAVHGGLAENLGVILVGDIVQATRQRVRSVSRSDERDTEDFPPPGFHTVSLGTNCRNGAPISQFVKLAAPTDFDFADSEVNSPSPRLYVGPLGDVTGVMRTANVVEQLVIDEDVDPADIVILRHGQGRRFDDVVEALEARGWSIPVYEVGTFLGSESPVVVFYDDLGTNDDDQRSDVFDVLRYLALTRACVLLAVIVDDDLHRTAIPPRYRDVLSLILAARRGQPLESVLRDKQVSADERRVLIDVALALGDQVVGMPILSPRETRRRLYARRRHT